MSSDPLSKLIEFRELVETVTDNEFETFISQFCELFTRADIIKIIYNALYQTRNKSQIKKVHTILTDIIHEREDETDNKQQSIDTNKENNKLILTDISSHSIQYTASFLSLFDLIKFEQTNRFIAICCRTSNASKHLNNSNWLQKYLKQNYNSSIDYSYFRNNNKFKHTIDIRSRFKNVTNITFNFNNIAFVRNSRINTTDQRRQLVPQLFYPLNNPCYISAVSKQLLSSLFKSVSNLHISMNDYWKTNIFDFNFNFNKENNESESEYDLVYCPHSQDACIIPQNISLLFDKLCLDNIICENNNCQHGQCWICLYCHGIFCSRYGNQCMLSHCLQTNKSHCIVMKIEEIQSIWCYKCDDYIHYTNDSNYSPVINQFYQIAYFATNNGNYDQFIEHKQNEKQITLSTNDINKEQQNENSDDEDEKDLEIFENLKVLRISNSSIKSVLKFVNDMNFPNVNQIEFCNLQIRIGRFNTRNVYDIYESIIDEEKTYIGSYIQSFVDLILPNYYILKSNNNIMNKSLRNGYEYLTIINCQFKTNEVYDNILQGIFSDKMNIIISLKDLKGFCVDNPIGVMPSLFDIFIVSILNLLSEQLRSLHLRNFPMIDRIHYKQILFKNLEELCIDTDVLLKDIHVGLIKKIKTLKRLNLALVRFARDKYETNELYIEYLSELSLIFKNNWHCLEYVNIRIFDTSNSVAIKEFIDNFIINGLSKCNKQIESLKLKFYTESTYFYYDINILKDILNVMYKYCINCVLVISNKMVDCDSPDAHYFPDTNKKFDEKIKNQFESILPELFTNKIVVNDDNGCCDMIIYSKRDSVVHAFSQWMFTCNHCDI